MYVSGWSLDYICQGDLKRRDWPCACLKNGGIAESDQVYADLIALADQLSEEDLTAFDRFDWVDRWDGEKSCSFHLDTRGTNMVWLLM